MLFRRNLTHDQNSLIDSHFALHLACHVAHTALACCARRGDALAPVLHPRLLLRLQRSTRPVPAAPPPVT